MDFIQAFITGIAIANLRNNFRFNSIILALCCINQYLWVKEDEIYNLFFIGTFIFLVVLPILERVKINNGLYRVMAFIALISYPLYLLHQNLGYGIMRVLISEGLTNELWLILPVMGSVILAYIVHRYVEIPTAKWNFKNWPNLISGFSKH